MKYHDYTWLKGFTAAIVALCLTLLFLFATPAEADVTDLRLGVGKVFDSQWTVGACTASSGTCTVSGLRSNQLYSPGVGFVNFNAGMTVRFSYNNGSNATNPIQLELWNADDTLNRVMIPYGRFIAFENGANEGRQYMFVDNSTWYGYYINLQATTSTTSSTWTHGGAATTAQYQALNQSMVTTPPPPIPTGTASPSSGSGLYPYTRGTSNRGWLIRWWDNVGTGSWSQSNASYSQGGTGSGFYSWVSGYLRWPGAMDGQSKTIWFRTGWDDDHRLYINGQQITNGVCCSYAYGSYTAKPGEVLYVQFYTNNSGGGPWSFEIAWDPQQDGTYEVLGGEAVAQEALGGSSWYSSTETAAQTLQKSTDKTRQAALAAGNKIYITQSGISPTVDVIQESNYNYVQGRGGVGDALLVGDYNTLRIRQGDGLGGSTRNLIEFDVNGSNNTVTLLQGWNGTWPAVWKDGIETGGHFMDVKLTGSNNAMTVLQANAGSTLAGHYLTFEVTGNSNSTLVRQAWGATGYHSFFGSITGNSNYVDVLQTGMAGKYMDLTLTGNGHTVVATQDGSGTHRATINLANAGGSSVLNLLQQGSVAQQYNITQACANLSGCSVTVTQGSP